MGGIIRGFLGGVGEGMAEAGKMLLADKLQKERDEANFLRDSELRRDMQAEGFRHDESMLTTRIGADDRRAEADRKSREKESEADRKSREKMEEEKLRSREKMEEEKLRSGEMEGELDRQTQVRIAEINAGGKSATAAQRDAAWLVEQGYPKDVANAVAHNAYKLIKDADTNDMVVINTLNNEPLGRLTDTGKGAKKWIPAGEQPANAQITAADRKAARELANQKASFFNFDSTDFPEGRDIWIKNKAQEIANQRRAKENQEGTVPVEQPGGGIINNAIQEPAVETKKIGRRDLSREDYITLMLARYPDADREEIGKQWDAK